MKMILIPEWVMQACAQHGKNMAQVFDNREALLGILSERDVDFYFSINTKSQLRQLFGDALANSVSTLEDISLGFIASVVGTGPTPEQIFFAEHQQSDPTMDGETVVEYSVHMLTCDVCYVKATRQRVASQQMPSISEQRKRLYRQCLAVLFARGGGPSIVRTPLFRSWLEQLA